MQNAISSGNLEAVRDLITKNPRELSTVYGLEDETALHLACLGQQYKICHYLLESKADASATDSNGNTPLHSLVVSAEEQAPEARSRILEILLSYGASVNAANKEGKTAAHLAAFRGFGNTLLLLSNQVECDLNKTDM